MPSTTLAKPEPPTSLDAVLSRDLKTRPRGWLLDEPRLTAGAALAMLGCGISIYFLPGVALSSFANAAAAGLVALCSIGVTVVVMAMPMLVSTKFVQFQQDLDAAKQALRGIVGVYWINIRAMMIAAFGATVFAMIGSMGLDSALDEYSAAVVVFFLVQGFGRCWLLLREALEAVIGVINSVEAPSSKVLPEVERAGPRGG
jgi:hypothetical protein